MSHPHRMSVPSSPGIPPSLYSGMSSLQITQAGPGSNAGSSYHPPPSQPQKALLKGPKTARHQGRKNEHSSSSVPWRDPREAAAASATRRRSLKDDASFRQGQTMWTPLPPDARPTTRDEGVVVMRSLVERLKAQEDACFRDAKLELRPVKDMVSNNEQRTDEFVEIINQDHRDLEPVFQKLLQMSPNEEFRQACQKAMNTYYQNRRGMELRAGHHSRV